LYGKRKYSVRFLIRDCGSRVVAILLQLLLLSSVIVYGFAGIFILCISTLTRSTLHVAWAAAHLMPQRTAARQQVSFAFSKD